MMITGKTYDVLKAIALIWLPAVGTLYFALAGIWGLPSAEEVVGTIVAINTFMGVVLQISSHNYTEGNLQAGSMVVRDTPEGKQYMLELDTTQSIDELDKADTLTFRVVKK